MKMILMILATVLIGCAAVALTSGSKNGQSLTARKTSEAMDKTFEYFSYMGNALKVDEKRQNELFTPDFQMIINGKLVVDGRDKLTPHFEHLFSQVERVDMDLHEKVVADNKCVMRYDVRKPGKSTSKVIAIFKFRNGRIYEMNEVVHSVNPEIAIDFMSR